MLPQQYTYVVKEYNEIELEVFAGAPQQAFSCTVLIDIETDDEASEWLKRFSENTATTYRVARGSKHTGCKTVYKTDCICQHKRKYSTKPKKNVEPSISGRNKKTNCPSKFTLTIYRYYENSRSKFSITKTHRCVLKLVWNHNHPLSSAHTLSFRPIGQDTLQRYNHYFHLGHGASSARHYHVQKLQIENDEDKIQQLLADRSINPNESDVHRVFRAWRERNYGKDNGKEMFDKLQELVDNYNSENSIN